MKSLIIKHSIHIKGHKTSVSLEHAFWKSLREIAATRHETWSHLIAYIDTDRQFANLSSAIRLFVLEFYKDQIDRQHRVSEPSAKRSYIGGTKPF
jgi:predicted DNA-binding ribbon-helix-helix protein